MVEKRNPWLVLILSFLTLGIYAIYWLVKTKKEINDLGAKIPTCWWLVIPILNIYWLYKYSEGFTLKIKKGDSPILWFLLLIVVGPIGMLLMQMELNKKAK